MSMKQHILLALREQYDSWDELLTSLTEAQATSPLPASTWCVKDVVSHLWAWQQRTTARVEAAAYNREPQFPRWPEDLEPDSEGSTNQVNTWIFETYRDQPWAESYRHWSEGFQHILQIAVQISERDLLDSDRYPWLKGAPLALILLATYDHHQEHYEKLQGALGRRG